MKFDDLLRGPSIKKVTQGKTDQVTFLIQPSRYSGIRSVEVAYTPVHFRRRYLFPWTESVHICLWHLKVIVRTKTRKFESVFVAEMPQDAALDYARLQGLTFALTALREEVLQPRRTA
jgi:hypothetical protein